MKPKNLHEQLDNSLINYIDKYISSDIFYDIDYALYSSLHSRIDYFFSLRYDSYFSKLQFQIENEIEKVLS